MHPQPPEQPVSRSRRRGRHCRGQVLLEFVVMLAMLLSVVLMLVGFLSVFTDYGWRLLHLISLKYP